MGIKQNKPKRQVGLWACPRGFTSNKHGRKENDDRMAFVTPRKETWGQDGEELEKRPWDGTVVRASWSRWRFTGWQVLAWEREGTQWGWVWGKGLGA